MALFTKYFDRQWVARAVKAGTVWTNTWASLSGAFEEDGFKYSGIGRARGLRAMEEFQEGKTQFSRRQGLGRIVSAFRQHGIVTVAGETR